MSEFFKFSVKMERLNAEVSSALGDVEKKIPGALQFVGAEMQDALVRHLWEDWYEAWGPPLDYGRDTDKNPAKSLISKKRMFVEVNGGTLLFDYLDTKRRAKYSALNGEVAGPWREPDQVIKIISRNAGWEFEPHEDLIGRPIMRRPFWNNFVKEMMNGGLIDSFVIGMQFQGETVQKEKKDVEFETDESLIY